jgi:acetyl-CoA synthetase
VAETAVVGFAHDVTGEAIYAFVILKNENKINENELRKVLRDMVKKSISGYAVPHKIMVNL